MTKVSTGTCKHYAVVLTDGVRQWTVNLSLDELQAPISDDDIETTTRVNLKRLRQQGAMPAQIVGRVILADFP